MSDSKTEPLGRPSSQLILRYLKHRWLRDVQDLLLQTGPALEFDDLDLDTDMVELTRAVGHEALASVALTVLSLKEVPAADDSALAALQPELEGPQLWVFLELVAVNLAFRMRSDELLRALAASSVTTPPPHLRPGQLGQLLARARSPHDASALLESAPLADEARAEAQASLQLAPLELSGVRLHVEGPHDELAAGLERVLAPWRRVEFGRAPAGARRFLASRRRGGFTTLMEEGETPPLELARALARQPGLKRVVLASLAEGTPELVLVEGSRVVFDCERLAARLGRAPGVEDLRGELLSLGILDLDPGHPRGVPPLTFEGRLKQRKKSVLSLAFAPPL